LPRKTSVGFRACGLFGTDVRNFSLPKWNGVLFYFTSNEFLLLGWPNRDRSRLLRWENTGLTLHHRPSRPSFGLSYVFCRKQSYLWRKCISASLLRRPTDLPRWHYNLATWPAHWAQIIQGPWVVGLRRFIRILAGNLGSLPKKGFKFFQSELFGAPFHLLLISWTYGFCRLKSGQGYDAHPSANHRV
jgi:hypothetical protein